MHENSWICETFLNRLFIRTYLFFVWPVQSVLFWHYYTLCPWHCMFPSFLCWIQFYSWNIHYISCRENWVWFFFFFSWKFSHIIVLLYGFVMKKQREKWWVWRFEPIQGQSIDFSSCKGIFIYYCGPKFLWFY